MSSDNAFLRHVVVADGKLADAKVACWTQEVDALTSLAMGTNRDKAFSKALVDLIAVRKVDVGSVMVLVRKQQFQSIWKMLDGIEEFRPQQVEKGRQPRMLNCFKVWPFAGNMGRSCPTTVV